MVWIVAASVRLEPGEWYESSAICEDEKALGKELARLARGLLAGSVKDVCISQVDEIKGLLDKHISFRVMYDRPAGESHGQVS